MVPFFPLLNLRKDGLLTTIWHWSNTQYFTANLFCAWMFSHLIMVLSTAGEIFILDKLQNGKYRSYFAMFLWCSRFECLFGAVLEFKYGIQNGFVENSSSSSKHKPIYLVCRIKTNHIWCEHSPTPILSTCQTKIWKWIWNQAYENR